MDFPAHQTPLHIHPWTMYSIGAELRQISGNTSIPVSSTWHAANEAIYIPVRIPFPYPVRRMFWGNGSTAAGNVDVGIYSPGKGRIFSSGSTAQSGTSNIQYVTLGTDILLAAGTYYIALAASATTNAVWGFSYGGTSTRLTGIQRQSTALPLPNPGAPTATPVGNLVVPLFGITRTTTGF